VGLRIFAVKAFQELEEGCTFGGSQEEARIQEGAIQARTEQPPAEGPRHKGLVGRTSLLEVLVALVGEVGNREASSTAAAVVASIAVLAARTAAPLASSEQPHFQTCL